MQNNRFAEFISHALAEYLKTVPGAKIEGNKIYKFSTKVWFDIENEQVKSISTGDTSFTELNNSLNKKYRKKCHTQI